MIRNVEYFVDEAGKTKMYSRNNLEPAKLKNMWRGMQARRRMKDKPTRLIQDTMKDFQLRVGYIII